MSRPPHLLSRQEAPLQEPGTEPCFARKVRISPPVCASSLVPGRRCASSAQSASGLRDGRRPALELCGSPGSVGEVRYRAPCSRENALPGADRSRRPTPWRRRRPRCWRTAGRTQLAGVASCSWVRGGIPRVGATRLLVSGSDSLTLEPDQLERLLGRQACRPTRMAASRSACATSCVSGRVTPGTRTSSSRRRSVSPSMRTC